MKHPAKTPLLRKEAFFGLHFDLHPVKEDTRLGKDLTEEMVERLLKKVKPDYVQYDCKGHPGYAGYSTKIGWPSPGIKKDSLATWRKITRTHGTALFVHYSGVWDSLAIEHHPEWARMDATGKPDKNFTSTFSPYVDELLIPQLKEIVDTYDVDGVWVDGDCWAVQPDFGPTARAAFTQATGMKEIPVKRGDPYWLEYLAFNREQFRKYVRKYVDALHIHSPGLELTSNWMFSTLMPEPVTVPIDFLSGDYSCQNSVDTARLEARYLSSTGRPWDLMAWGFNRGDNCPYGWTLKTALQLQQEAVVVLAQGGGFQFVCHPTRSGLIEDWLMDMMAEVAQFCRARQAVSHQTQSVPQVALLLPGKSIYERADVLFGPPPLDHVRGTLHALLELHYSVDIMAEHRLQENLSQYPVVVLSECHTLPGDLRSALLDRVRGGGRLLLIGAETAALFEDALGVTFKGRPTEINTLIKTGNSAAWLGGVWQMVQPTTAGIVGRHYPMSSSVKVMNALEDSLRQDMRGPGECAATVNRHGKGRIAAIYGPLGSVHCRAHYPPVREFLGEVMRRLFPEPVVEIEGPPCIDISIRRKDDTLLIHLANTAGRQSAANYAIIDFIPSVGPIEVTVRLDKKPRKVSLVPTDDAIATRWSKGKLHVTLPALHIHTVLVIEWEQFPTDRNME